MWGNEIIYAGEKTETKSVDSIVENILQQLDNLSENERMAVVEKIGNKYCLLCGSGFLPCYCSPAFDQ